MRLIDANKLIYSISKKLIGLKAHEGLRAVRIVAECIVDAPTIEAKPVVYGKWEVVSNGEDKWVNKCTACGAYLKRGYKQTNYCPNCGANMFKKEGE